MLDVGHVLPVVGQLLQDLEQKVEMRPRILTGDRLEEEIAGSTVQPIVLTWDRSRRQITAFVVCLLSDAPLVIVVFVEGPMTYGKPVRKPD